MADLEHSEPKEVIQQNYIRASSLDIEQLEELQAAGTVEVDGGLYTVWNSDAAGDLWLKRIEAAAETKSIRESFPELFAVEADDDAE
ncbi:hypothetical protein [Lacipirellula limnantheis]|uniref:Uncharacterized protein n=1 Tax=Lacipirellula limnantheis TaxID=2528024 RepID=A0A517U1E2_9BACT|nr:hypothetical protein [Lacipirellula limnantheis]QDT74431.1 hypothetical protein I41_36270 [Lacipirellula limnantheis]